MIKDYLNITIGGMEVNVTSPEELLITISYQLESPEDFQAKNADQALGLVVPATLINQKATNNFSSPDSKDLTSGEIFRTSQPCNIVAGTYELLTGKAFLKNAKHTDRPQQYEYNLYGGNADWLLDLQESTLYDFLKQINFIFDKQPIIDSWQFDGTNPALPYVFAPVRYRQPPGGYKTNAQNESVAVNDNFLPIYLKPSISKYFILYWALKSVGYKIESHFFDTPFFRRQVMPWTWGSFLESDGTKLDVHKFKAISSQEFYFSGSAPSSTGYEQYENLNVIDTLPGTFDNGGTPGDYVYDAANMEMVWTYNAQDFGYLWASFNLKMYYNYRLGGNNTDSACRIHWFRTEATTGIKTLLQIDVIYNETGPFINTSTNAGAGIKEVFLTNAPVRIGDKISAKVRLRRYESKQFSHELNVRLKVEEFSLDYFRVPLAGTIDLANYTAL